MKKIGALYIIFILFLCGFIKGLFIDVIYEDGNNKNELADRIKFAKYIKEM